MGKIIKFGKEAHSLILEGVDELEKTVISTLGPRGRTVIIDNKTTRPTLTKDGVSVARAISFSDKYKNIGASLVKDAAARTNREAGDGTTTTVLLTSEFIKKGLELINLGFERNDIKNAFYKAYNDIVALIPDYIKKIESIDDIEHVATISANNDVEIGKTIREAFEYIGDDGTVSLLDSYNGKTVVKVKQGYEMPTGYISSLYSNTKENTFEANDVRVLIIKDPVETIETLKPILDLISINKQKLVIMAPLFDESVHGIVAENVRQKKIECILVRTPGNSIQTIEEAAEDLAALLNITIFTKDDMDTFSPSKHFGTCGTVKISNQKSVFLDVKEDVEKLAEYVSNLRSQLDNQNEDEAFTEKDIGTIKERIARLSGGIATIYIGADSEIEMKEKRDRYEDALNAVRAAISSGIIPGGGSTLAKIVYKLEQYDRDKTTMLTKAYDAFLDACKIPCEMIIKSSGIKSPYLEYEKIASNKNNFFGFNAKKEVMTEDMIKDGIIDPALVIQAALKYATSISTTFISSDAVIVDDIDNLSLHANDPIMNELGDF